MGEKMRKLIYDGWNGVMNYKMNPLKNIPDLQVRHMVMPILAWMWCIAFAIIVGSWTAFGVSAIIRVVLLGAICVTVATFETAKRKPTMFDLRPGYHSVSRTRQTMWIDGKKIQLDKNDPGGEHE